MKKRILENKEARLQKILNLKNPQNVEMGERKPEFEETRLENSNDQEPKSEDSLLNDDDDDDKVDYPVQQYQMEFFHSLVFNMSSMIAFGYWLFTHTHSIGYF